MFLHRSYVYIPSKKLSVFPSAWSCCKKGWTFEFAQMKESLVQPGYFELQLSIRMLLSHI